MASSSFKNFVGPKAVRVKEVRNATNKTQSSERNDKSFLNTNSWPELPKSQNAPNRNLKSWHAAEKLSVGAPKNELSPCEAVKISECSRRCTSQKEQMVEMPAYSEGIHRQTVARHDNRNTSCSEKSDTFHQEFRSYSNGSKHSESNDLSKGTSMDGRRRQQASKRTMLKEEKKRLREAEILRKRVEPKGQNVRVISHRVLEMVLKSDKHSMSVNNQQKCDIAGPNFPTLDEATKKSKNKSPKDSVPQSADNEESCISGSNPVVTTVTSKRNKHKEPLEINIHNLIKDSSRKSCDKGWKSSKGPNTHLKAKKEAVPYIGNQLDSANPERKRGKQREKPKKKRVTQLKMAILEARALRKHLHEVEEQSKIVSNIPEIKFFKEEVIELEHINDVKENENFNKKPSANAAQRDVGLLQERHTSRLPINLQNTSHDSSATAANVKETKPSSVDSTDIAAAEEGDKAVIKNDKSSAKKLPQHSRKFREYCDHILTNDLNNSVKSLIIDIVKFQERFYQRDPIKAFAKRRYVVGFREVKKHLQLKRLKLVIIAPDLEVAKNEGGTDNAVAELKDMANLQCVPYVFALNRRSLGYITYKKVGVSCIGVVNYEGTEDNFTAIIEALPIARVQYSKMMNNEVVTSPQNNEVATTSQNNEVSTTQKEEPEETKDKTEISDSIAASLLAKLRDKSSENEMQCKESTPRFLAALDKFKSEDPND